jgi:hypothetical protein
MSDKFLFHLDTVEWCSRAIMALLSRALINNYQVSSVLTLEYKSFAGILTSFSFEWEMKPG